MNSITFPSLSRVLGAMAVLAAALVFLTAFDWGSPPSASRLPMRTLPPARSR